MGEKKEDQGILVEHLPSDEHLQQMGIRSWPIWTKEESQFPWTYDECETCFFLEGDVEVTPDGGKPVRVGKGDLVTFPSGMKCDWKVTVPAKKHYRIGEED